MRYVKYFIKFLTHFLTFEERRKMNVKKRSVSGIFRESKKRYSKIC
nr:MAG TPA: hypothetical protein [Caudoviricetes sp.]